ncbi:MAG: hypothetical protein H0W54_04010 [Rubrobacter sp.]|nr:hypothetical protein [Rubrobacter sp.]
MSWTWRYRHLARNLREISGREVHIVPLTPLDYLAGHIRGYGQLIFEIASTVDNALLNSESKKAILIGHSIGGVASRVYIGGDPPYGGRRYAGHRRISHLITLGSPHLATGRKPIPAIDRTNKLFPGALHEKSGLKYLSVAGAATDGTESVRSRRRYERLVEDGRVPGDGVVPVESALLPGAEQVVLDDIHHSAVHERWYGADLATVERWWPAELRAATPEVAAMRGAS